MQIKYVWVNQPANISLIFSSEFPFLYPTYSSLLISAELLRHKCWPWTHLISTLMIQDQLEKMNKSTSHENGCHNHVLIILRQMYNKLKISKFTYRNASMSSKSQLIIESYIPFSTSMKATGTEIENVELAPHWDWT